LESTKFLKEGKKYEECVNQASAVPQKSRFYADAQNLLNECQFFARIRRGSPSQTYKTRTTSKMRELLTKSSQTVVSLPAQQLIISEKPNG